MVGDTINPTQNTVLTAAHLINSRGSRSSARSLSAMTSATLSGETVEKPRNSKGETAAKTSMTMTTIGAMLTRKALNDRPLRAPMMMLGGSPTSVAAPPMLDANTSAISIGTGLISSRSQTSKVTGAIKSTETTLGSTADAAAITSIRRIMMRNREAVARLAAQIAAYSQTPVCCRMLTIIIMPNIKNMTSQSIPVSAEKNTSGEVTPGRRVRRPAPLGQT